MFFKNALVYRIVNDLNLTREALAEALASKLHREPASQEIATYGFIAPFSGELVESVNGVMLIATKKTERILPGSVVREELKKKIDEIEARDMRKVYKKERDQLKDELVQTLLPRAFLRNKATFAMLFGDMIIVDSTSAKNAEDLLSTLREALGSLPVRPLTVKVAPTASLTQWVKDQAAPNDFFLLDECDLRDTHEDGGVVRCKRQDLTSEETQLHLTAGKLVTKLSMAWSDKLSFVIDDKLTIKRIRFEDLLQQEAEKDGGDDQHGQLVASLAIASGALYKLTAELVEVLGGEEVPTGI